MYFTIEIMSSHINWKLDYSDYKNIMIEDDECGLVTICTYVFEGDAVRWLVRNSLSYHFVTAVCNGFSDVMYNTFENIAFSIRSKKSTIEPDTYWDMNKKWSTVGYDFAYTFTMKVYSSVRHGEIYTYVFLARRRGEQWYVSTDIDVDETDSVVKLANMCTFCISDEEINKVFNLETNILTVSYEGITVDNSYSRIDIKLQEKTIFTRFHVGETKVGSIRCSFCMHRMVEETTVRKFWHKFGRNIPKQIRRV